MKLQFGGHRFRHQFPFDFSKVSSKPAVTGIESPERGMLVDRYTKSEVAASLDRDRHSQPRSTSEFAAAFLCRKDRFRHQLLEAIAIAHQDFERRRSRAAG